MSRAAAEVAVGEEHGVVGRLGEAEGAPQPSALVQVQPGRLGELRARVAAGGAEDGLLERGFEGVVHVRSCGR